MLPEEIFQRYGMPYFLKIDIEGYDHYVIRALRNFSSRPAYLSVEDNGIHSMVELYNAGCRMFQFLNQVEKSKLRLPKPAKEGNYVETTFGACTSGPFGKELPGKWLEFDQSLVFYLEKIRPPRKGLKGGWWDIHVKFDTEVDVGNVDQDPLNFGTAGVLRANAVISKISSRCVSVARRFF